MAKRKDTPSRTPTRKQIVLSRRERGQVRKVYIGLGIVAGLVLIVLAFGLVQTYIIEPNRPVATVDGDEIVTRAYQDRVRYERFLLDAQFQQIQQQQATLAQSTQDDQLSQLLANQYEQLASQLLQQRSVVDRQALDLMIEEELIEAEAARRGITVSEQDVTEAINRILAAQLGGVTAAEATETVAARTEAAATAALWTPTPTLTPSPTLTVTGSITPTPTLPEPPTPGPTPTLNVIEAGSLGSEYQDWLDLLAENVELDEATYRDIIRRQVLRDKLGEAMGEELPIAVEQAQARHILVETEEEAQEVIDRLEAGEDFGEVAADVSLDTGSAAQGGDLGFVPQGRFVGPIDEAVFSLPLGQISQPIQSDFGWHVIEVLKREVRDLPPADYRRSQQAAFRDWLEDSRLKAEIQDFWTPDTAPSDPIFGS